MRYQLFAIGNLNFLNIQSAGYAKNPSVTRFNGRRQLFIVHYILAGAGYFNGTRVCAKQGFLTTPNMEEDYYPDENEPWKFVWFIFDDSATAALFEEFNADTKTRVFDFDNLDVLDNLAKRLMQEKEKTVNATLLLEMFLHVFNTQKQKISAKSHSIADTYFEFSKNYINNHLYSKITVQQLTKLLGISQPRLYDIFREKTGISPKQYIDACKLTQAKSLLKETDMTITQVANSIGFSDVLAFSKFFSAKEKISPTNYRKG